MQTYDISANYLLSRPFQQLPESNGIIRIFEQESVKVTLFFMPMDPFLKFSVNHCALCLTYLWCCFICFYLMCFFEVFGQRTVRPALKLAVDDMAVVFILIVRVHVSA